MNVDTLKVEHKMTLYPPMPDIPSLQKIFDTKWKKDQRWEEWKKQHTEFVTFSHTWTSEDFFSAGQDYFHNPENTVSA